MEMVEKLLFCLHVYNKKFFIRSEGFIAQAP